MGKKIFAVLLLLSFACAGLQAQNKKDKNKKREEKDLSTSRTKKDLSLLNYSVVRNLDSITSKKSVQQLLKSDVGATSVATVMALFHPFILPPLDEMFERAKNNPNVIYRQHEMDYAWRNVISVRRKWLSWFSANAAYSYGKYNSNMYYQQTNIPTANSYSNQATSYYMASGSVSVNLYELINLDNSTKQAKELYYAQQNAYRTDYEKVLEQVNTVYNNIVTNLSLLPHSLQWAKLSEMAYEDDKLNYINGRTSTDGLFKTESQYYRAMQELSGLVNSLNTDVKFLELVTDSRIIPDEAK